MFTEESAHLLTQSDVIARTLAERGVEYAFGLPGGEVAAFIDACQRAGIRFLLTGHENSAALIAQVLGQITGTPGVCVATLGPGATNLVTGVANAFLDRSPLLAVTAQIPHTLYDTLTHQRLPLNALFTLVTKRSATVGPGETAELVRDCLALASEPRPGPVHLLLPSDVAIQEFRLGSPSEKQEVQGEREKANHLAEIVEKIEASERPLFVVGLGVPTSAAAAVRKLIDVLQAPFLVTPKVKGILREDDPLFLGIASGMALDQKIVETIHAADLVVSVGFDPVEADKPWFADLNVVGIDAVSMASGTYHPLEIIGNLSKLIDQLARSIKKPRPWPESLLKARQQALRPVPRPANHGVSPVGLIEGLRLVFPENGIVTCDVGSHKLLMGQFWRSYEPGTFFMSNGLSGMGYGVPAAIATQLAYPHRSVMTVVGDGGMLMMAHDLPLIRELSLPVIIIVLVDRSLSLIRVAQERRGFHPCGVDFNPPDFASLANSFGLHGERASTIAEAKSALEKALEHRRPAIIEVPIDSGEYYDLV